MSRLFHESFDILSPAQLQSTTKWAFVGLGVVAATGKTGAGVTGTSGASETDNSLRSRMFVPGTPDTGFCGFAIRPSSLPGADQKIWELRDNAGSVQVTAVMRSDGTLRVYRGTTSGTLLGTTSVPFVAAAAWRYLEFGFVLQGTSPVVQVRSTTPGTSALNVAYMALGTAYTQAWAQIVLFVTDTIIVDDFYVNDATRILGIYSNAYTFSGETSVVVLRPVAVTADSAYDPWAPNTGSDRIAVIDDTAFDEDTTYDRTRQSYSTLEMQMETLTDDGRTVSDVQLVALMRVRSSSFTPGVQLQMTRWDGIRIYVGKTPDGVTQTTYTAFCGVSQGVGALGPQVWTIARVNASRFGVHS